MQASGFVGNTKNVRVLGPGAKVESVRALSSAISIKPIPSPKKRVHWNKVGVESSEVRFYRLDHEFEVSTLDQGNSCAASAEERGGRSLTFKVDGKSYWERRETNWKPKGRTGSVDARDLDKHHRGETYCQACMASRAKGSFLPFADWTDEQWDMPLEQIRQLDLAANRALGCSLTCVFAAYRFDDEDEDDNWN